MAGGAGFFLRPFQNATVENETPEEKAARLTQEELDKKNAPLYGSDTATTAVEGPVSVRPDVVEEDKKQRVFTRLPQYKDINPSGWDFLRRDFAEKYSPMPLAWADDIIQEVARDFALNHDGNWPSSVEVASSAKTEAYAQAWFDGWHNWPEVFNVGGIEYDNIGLGAPTPTSNAPFDQSEVDFLKKQPGLQKEDRPAGSAGVNAIFQQANIRPSTFLTPKEIQDLIMRAPKNADLNRGSQGRQARGFDKRALAMDARNYLEVTLRETADEGEIDALVAEYMSEAQALWMSSGTSVELEPFLAERVKGKKRYHMLYDRKPAGVSEREYMAKFDNTTAAFGLTEKQSRPRAERAASRGIGQKSFAEGLAVSNPVRRQGGGTFSQKFAQTLASVGGIGRS